MNTTIIVVVVVASFIALAIALMIKSAKDESRKRESLRGLANRSADVGMNAYKAAKQRGASEEDARCAGWEAGFRAAIDRLAEAKMPEWIKAGKSQGMSPTEIRGDVKWTYDQAYEAGIAAFRRARNSGSDWEGAAAAAEAAATTSMATAMT